MQIAVDISLYPLTEKFIPPIKDVISRLAAHDGIDVTTNPMSTRLHGEYNVVMRVLQQEMKTSFENLPKAVFVVKILNNPANAG